MCFSFLRKIAKVLKNEEVYLLASKVLKKALGLAAALVCFVSTSMFFAGCSEAGEEAEAYPTVPVLTDTRPTEEKMNTFTTLNGNEVTYNMNTRRIVALSGAGDLAAFGIRPYAVIADRETTARYPDFFNGVETLNYTQPYNAEEIMSYEPDLILVYQMMESNLIEQLEKIAPVIPLYRESFDFEERLGYIGEIFGLEQNAQTLIRYAEETKNAALKEVADLKISDKTVSIFYYFDGVSVPPTDYWYFNKIVYDYLGLKRPEKIEEFLESQVNPFTPISNETLYMYEGDIVIYADITASGTIPDTLAVNEGWMRLNAVRENKVGIIDALLYAEKDVLYLRAQYDGILNALKKSGGV